MQGKYSTNIKVNKVRIGLKITAYWGFILLAAFFEKIKLRDISEEVILLRNLMEA